MDRKTINLLAIVASVLLCGCPGVFLCFFSVSTMIGGTRMSLDRSIPPIQPIYGYLLLCLSLIFIAAPIVVVAITMRKRPENLPPNEHPINEPPPPPSGDKPLPPTS